MRGGTSKALFFRAHDLPPPGPGRDHIFKRAMGTPDGAQIDGMVRVERDGAGPGFATLGFARTARRLMAGCVYVPRYEID